MSRHSRLSSLLWVALLPADHAGAQDAQKEFLRGLTAQERAAVVAAQPASTDATAASTLGLGTVVNLLASREKKEVAAQIGWQNGDNSVAFKFAGPIGEEDPQAVLLDLAGLAGDASAEVKLTRVKWHVQPLNQDVWSEFCYAHSRSLSPLQIPSDGKLAVGDIVHVRDALRLMAPLLAPKLGLLAGQIDGPFANDEAVAAAKETLVKVVNEALAEESFTRELLARINPSPMLLKPEASLLSKEDRMKLNRRMLDQLVHDAGSKAIRPAGDPCVDSILDDESRKAVVKLLNPGDVWWFGFSAKAARTDFKYLNETSLAAEQRTRYATAFTASVGLLTKKNYFFSASVSAQEKYKAADDPLNLCQPFKGGPSLSCDKVVIGGPTGKKRTVSTLEMRIMSGSLAMSPSLAYASDEKKAVLTIPIYFLKDKDQGLRGGVTLKAVKGDWAIALFVGNVFKLGG